MMMAQVTHGDGIVFLSSVKKCLEDIAKAKAEGKLQDGVLAVTEAELSCMKKVLEVGW